MSNNSNIVVEWLRSLHLGQYAESFLDNGYDDLEICKQVGDPDLDAIGVFNPAHRSRLLQSVRTLREEGAASVYFTLEESAAIQEECQCDSASARSSRTSSGRVSDKDPLGRSPAGSSSAGSAQELGRYLDEYEEGKAELVRIPRLQLKLLLKEKLAQDGIKLSCQPYSTSEGERGYLEGLASRYADLYNTHYRDVLEHLEELRRREWAELSPRIRVLGTPSTPPGPAPSTPQTRVPNTGLTTSQSQPIYVPGKYSPSSCLSDKEEDEIYGFAGYGIYGRQMLHRQQQAKLVITPRPNYQNCLSPRSAYFYEFPPNERTGKKRTSFSRFLRHLKTHRKEKTGSPRLPSTRVGTPDGLGDPPTVLPPLDYDRLRYLQKTQGASGNSFEETIHRLKVQEALKKKERFDREHEEILRDIRQGLLQLGRNVGGARVGVVGDDTYMYDDEMQRLGQHWYDEPPYESDPEDFLMADTANNSRVCFTLNVRTDGRGAGESAIISLRSAGDISLPHHQRGLLLPQAGPYPPTLIPLTHARSHRESGDYAASDVQSICSRLSSLSMETSRSEQLEPELYHRLRPYNGGDAAVSPGHSSDYAEQEELVTLHSSCGNTSLAHRVRGLKSDGIGLVGNKVISSRHHHHHHHHHHMRSPQESPASLPHHSSAESLPSGSSTQALVPPSSNHSSEECASPTDSCVVIGRARALVDYTPSPYDKDVLKFKKGDIIEVLSMNASGLWRGRAHGRIGHFKFINVELLPEAPLRQRNQSRHRPQTLEQMLRTIHMEEHMSLFVLNGYEDLDAFCEIEEKDLDYLGITDPQQRAKILAAVQVLNEYESPDEGRSSSDEAQNSQLGGTVGLPVDRELTANNLGSDVNVDNPKNTANVSCKDMAELMQQNYLPNIPLVRTKNSMEMNALNDKTAGDTVVEKVSVVKYIGGDLNCEGGNPGQARNCSTLSEKSSDSGVSSSSLSSSNHNAVRNKQRRNTSKTTLIESPTHSYSGHLMERKD